MEERGVSKIGIKLKFADFQVTTKELKHDHIDLALFFELLEEAAQRGEGKPIRLLGAHIGLQEQTDTKPQMALSF